MGAELSQRPISSGEGPDNRANSIGKDKGQLQYRPSGDPEIFRRGVTVDDACDAEKPEDGAELSNDEPKQRVAQPEAGFVASLARRVPA